MLLAYDFRSKPFMRGRVRLCLRRSGVMEVFSNITGVWLQQEERRIGEKMCFPWSPAEVDC
jgi:hypothetical protein